MRTSELHFAIALLLALLGVCAAHAHPGAAIAVSKEGVVYFVDTGAGVFSIEPNGHTVRRAGPAFHWFAFDPQNRFRRTQWPSLPNAEFQSAGDSPTIVLSSDFPVTIGTDGSFYYPDGSRGGRIRITAIDPAGRRSIRATLPPIRRGGEPITWLNGLAAGPDGALYYTEDRIIRKIDARGNVTTVAANVSVQDCARIPMMDRHLGPYLRGLAISGDGSIYVAASGCGAVLKVDGNGRTATVLRSSPPYSPTAVAVSGGDVFVLEYLHTASDDRREWIPRVRKLAKSGAVSTLGGGTRK